MDYLPELGSHVLTLRRYGGPLSFWEKLKRGGGGSGKVVYETGVPEFDRYRVSSPEEEIFVTLEHLQAGVVMWMQKHLRVAGLAFSLDELTELTLALDTRAVFPPGLPLREAARKKTYPAYLFIRLDNGTQIRLRVIKAHFRQVFKFLTAEPLGHHLEVIRYERADF